MSSTVCTCVIMWGKKYYSILVLDLTKKLLHEQVQAREDLVGSVEYEEHVQKPMGARYAFHISVLFMYLFICKVNLTIHPS